MGSRPGCRTRVADVVTAAESYSSGDKSCDFTVLQANTLINLYGEDLDAIFGMTSVATPSSADAVTQAGLCGEVAVIGLATPNAMKPYVSEGCVESVVLWNPVDLGYAATYVMRALADGELEPGATSVSAGRLGDLQIVNGSEVLLGAPFIFTPDNIDDFDF